jgi:hypothetical protein
VSLQARAQTEEAALDELVDEDVVIAPPPDLDEVDLETEFIDESESEAAPAATDR